MSSWAKLGMKCVCVNNTPKPGWSYDELPAVGKVYTIAGFYDHQDGSPSFLLEECENYCPVEERDVGWDAARFRPLVTKTQQEDVELFRHLLTSSEERV